MTGKYISETIVHDSIELGAVIYLPLLLGFFGGAGLLAPGGLQRELANLYGTGKNGI